MKESVSLTVRGSVIVGLVVGVAFFTLLTVIIDISVSPAIPQEQLVEIHDVAITTAMSLPEVKDATRNASHVTTDSRLLPFDRDRITVSVIGSIDYKPLYNNSGTALTDIWLLDLAMEIQLLENATGFTRVEAGNKKITIDIDRKTNSVLSTKIDSLPDKIINAKFAERQKRAINLVLSDDRVQELAAKHNYFIQQLRPGVGSSTCSDPEGCILVGLGLIAEPRLGAHTAVIVDIAAGKVLNVSPPLNER